VQEEINSQEANLEALLAQQRSLAHQTSYATISVTVIGQHAAPVKQQAKIPGFLAGLRGGWHALVLVVGWALTALGSALPLGILLVALGIALVSWRRFARRRTPPAADPPAAAAS
jgi:Flp pilus assembly protein TadB